MTFTHTRNFLVYTATLLLFTSGCSAPAKRLSNADLWAAASGPTPDEATPIGGNGAGCLKGASTLRDGEGFFLMRQSRNRYYGHPSLIRFVEALSQGAVAQSLGTVLVGDMSQPRGGPMKTGHRSHQTGLDVDIWFKLLPPQGKGGANLVLASADRESMGSPSVVEGDHLHPQYWSRKAAALLKLAAEDPEVDRIFVNPVIKREFCIQLSVGERAWIRKLRPWWGHDSHFHVRLRCPKNAPLCHPTEEIPAGDGCDETLNWWFSQEADEMGKATEPASPPVLPAECEPVLDFVEQPAASTPR